MTSDPATMLRMYSDLERLMRATGLKESKVGTETAGEGEDIEMLVAAGVKVDIAVKTLVGVIVAMDVDGIGPTQAMNRNMASSAGKINRFERNTRVSSFSRKRAKRVFQHG